MSNLTKTIRNLLVASKITEKTAGRISFPILRTFIGAKDEFHI